jgi:hypothetical protein
MRRSRIQKPPRWMFLLLSIGGSWASGIYLGKVTIEGPLTDHLLPMISFAILGLIMVFGALSERRST